MVRSVFRFFLKTAGAAAFVIGAALTGLAQTAGSSGPIQTAGPSDNNKSSGISIVSSVDRSRMTIGDLVRYRVTVTHDPKIKVDMPGQGANLGGFEIRDYKILEPKKTRELVESAAEYTISTFFVGEFVIPPLTIQYSVPPDTLVRTMNSESIRIVVESVKPSEAGDIRDIKPPREIPSVWWRQILPYAIGLFATALAVLGWIIYKRKKAGKGILPIRTAPLRPPHEIALEALDKLRDSDILRNGEIKKYYTELSDIIRIYIGGRYYIDAMELTTTETMRALADSAMGEEDLVLFDGLFRLSDLVKFAKRIPNEKEHEQALGAAYEIVNRTKIIDVAPPEEAENPPAQEGVTSISGAEADRTKAEPVTAEQDTVDPNKGVGP
jgi:hypothetical protein